MPSSAFKSGDKIGKHYVVKKKIGEGQFSEVYEVEKASSKKQYALKIEKDRDIRITRQELKALQRLQGCGNVCKLYNDGSEDGRSYFVMQLLGGNLAEIIKRDYGGKAPLNLVKGIATELLNALEGCHKEGYIHRDVKPANFAIDPSTASASNGTWKLIDFGLARRYIDKSGNILPPRDDAGFRGSTTYASLYAHEDKDLGRRDDLWSWFYILVEMIEGSLPWRLEREAGAAASEAMGASSMPSRNAVEDKKRECMAYPDKLFSSGSLPPVVGEINEYLRSLNFVDTPKYPYLRSLLYKLDSKQAGEEGAEAGRQQQSPAVALEKAEDKGAGAAATQTENNLSRSETDDRRGNGDKVERENDDDARRRKSKDRLDRAPPSVSERDTISIRDKSRRDRSRSPRGRDRRHRSRSLSRRRRRSRSRGRNKDHSRSRSRGRSRSRSRSPPRRTSDHQNNNAVTMSDAQKRFEHTVDFVAMLKAGGISAEGAAAARQLRMLQPTEALGICCMMIDELATGTQDRQASLLSAVLEDIAAYAQVTANRCNK